MRNERNNKEFVISWIEKNCANFYKYADIIWSYAELGCEEINSSKILVKLLKDNEFEVNIGIAGMPTSFIASWGHGKPRIGFNCEYDALPGLSQFLDIKKNPVVEGAPGHGCGHNLLGVGAIMAAIATKEWLLKVDIDATIVIFGTPAEELCIGKPYMAKAGFFDDIDVVIDWHPWFHNRAGYDTCNAYFSLKYHFIGRTAHGNAPWEGRSAFDSSLLMSHSIELLREHITPGYPDAANTINYTISDIGPEYPSVVPDRSTVWVIGRITTSKELSDIMERLDNCAKGASLATGTIWKRDFITATHEKIPNKTIANVLYSNLLEIGPPRFNEEEQKIAKKMQKNFYVPEEGLSEDIVEFSNGASAVTDNSEYSWFAPFAMVWITTVPSGIGWHNWQVTSMVRSSVGKKAMIAAAKILSASAIDLLTQPRIIKLAKEELLERLSGRKYVSLIPENSFPPQEINHEIMQKYRPLMEVYYENFDEKQ